MGFKSDLLSTVTCVSSLFVGYLFATVGINLELEQRGNYLQNLPNREYVNPMIIDDRISSLDALTNHNCPDFVKYYNGNQEMIRKYIGKKVNEWDNLYTKKYGKSRYSDMTYEEVIKAKSADFCAVSYDLAQQCRLDNVRIDPGCPAIPKKKG